MVSGSTSYLKTSSIYYFTTTILDPYCLPKRDWRVEKVCKVVMESGSKSQVLVRQNFSWKWFHGKFLIIVPNLVFGFGCFSWKWFHGKIDNYGDLPEFWKYKRILLLPWNQSQSFIFCSFIKIRHWMVFRRTEFYF